MGNVRIARAGRGHPRTRPDRVLADKAYSSSVIRASLHRRRIKATIPHKGNERAARDAFDTEAYKQRNIVERTINKLRDTRAVATRYDKREYVYAGTIDVASIRIWLRDPPQNYLRDRP